MDEIIKDIDASITIDYKFTPPKVTMPETNWETLRIYVPELDDSIYMEVKLRLSGLIVRQIHLGDEEEVHMIRSLLIEELGFHDIDNHFSSGDALGFMKLFDQVARIEISKKITSLLLSLSAEEAEQCQPILKKYSEWLDVQFKKNRPEH